MNLSEYVLLMKESGSIVGTIGVALVALFLIIIIFKMLGGMRRGFWRQLVRTGMTLLAAIISYTAAVFLSNSIIGAIKVEALDGLFVQLDAYVPGISEKISDALASFDPTLIESIMLLPATIILIPVIATVIFLVINFILKIVRAILIRIFAFKRAKKNPQRLGGAILSAVEAIIWIVMVMLPICGVLSLVDQAYDKAMTKANEDESSAIVETYDNYLRPFTDNPAICFIEALGTNAMSDGIATVKIDGEKTNMREEVLSIADVIIIDAAALKGADFTALNENQKNAVGSIVDTLAQSPYMSNILVHLFKSVPTVYESGLIPVNNLGDEYKKVIDSFVEFFDTAERQNLGADLNTLKSFYFGFCDSGIMSAIKNGEDIMQFINNDYKNDKHILNMVNTLSGNARTQKIVDGLYNLVLNVAFSGAMSSPDNDGNTPGPVIDIVEVKNGLNNIVSVKKDNYETEEEYREVLSETIDTTLNDTIGVDLEDDVVEEITNYIDQNFSEQIEELTDEKFNEIIFEVIDIYQGFLNGDEINPDDLNDILGENGINPDDLGDILGGQ